MARTKQTASKSTGGKSPVKSLAGKAACKHIQKKPVKVNTKVAKKPYR